MRLTPPAGVQVTTPDSLNITAARRHSSEPPAAARDLKLLLLKLESVSLG